MHEWQGHARPELLGRDHLAILIGAGAPGCESFLRRGGGEKDSYASETCGNALCGFTREHSANQFDPIEHGPHELTIDTFVMLFCPNIM